MAIRLTSGFGGAYIRQGHDDVGEPVDGTFVVNVALPLGLDRTDTYTGREEVKAAIRGAKYARLVPLSETPWEDDGE